jgi:glycosyltransferase involved in cell wall biosynthesis
VTPDASAASGGHHQALVISLGELHGQGYGTYVHASLAALLAAGCTVHHLALRVGTGDDPAPGRPWPGTTRHDVVVRQHRVIHHLSRRPRAVEMVARAAIDMPADVSVAVLHGIQLTGLLPRLRAERTVVTLPDDEWARQLSFARAAGLGPRAASRGLDAAKYRYWQRRVIGGAGPDVEFWALSDDDARSLAVGAPLKVVPPGPPAALRTIERRPGPSLLFVGPGDYEANARGLAWFDTEVRPRLRHDAPLVVAGRDWRRQDYSTAIRFAGYVDDLSGEYARARAVVVPLFHGGGVKVKAIEAMAAGIPVVSTPHGVAGLPASPGVLVAADAAGFARHLDRLAEEPGLVDRLGAANRAALTASGHDTAMDEAVQQVVARLADTRVL